MQILHYFRILTKDNALRLLLILTILSMSPLIVKADGLVLVISNPNGSVTASTPSYTFFGSITNNSIQPINIGTPGFPRGDPFSYLVDIQFQLGNVGLSYGPAGFNDQVPLTLGAGASTGEIPLFTLNIPTLDQPNPAYTLLGTFRVFTFVNGGSVVSTLQPFSVQVPAGVPSPEPTALLLFGTGVSTLLVVLGRRRSRLSSGD